MFVNTAPSKMITPPPSHPTYRFPSSKDMSSSSNVVDLSAGQEEGTTPFVLKVTPPGDFQAGSFKDVVAASLRLCLSIGKEQRIHRRQKDKLSICCATREKKEALKGTAGCPYFVSAVVGGVGEVRVAAFNAGHTCHGSKARTRQAKADTLATVGTTLSSFVPANGRKGGNTRQLQQMARSVDGIALKPGQAWNILKDLKGGDGVHLAHYRLLPAVFEHLLAQDPQGVYDLKTEPASATDGFLSRPQA